MTSIQGIARALLILLGTQAWALPCIAQSTSPIELRIASTAPQKSVWGMQLDRMSTAFADESKGTVKVENYFGGQLGTELELAQQVSRGRLDGAALPLGTLSTLVPELQVLGLPMYFRDEAEIDCVLDGGLRQSIEERLAKRNVKLLGFGEVGAMHLVGKRPFNAPTDLSGLKAGSYGLRSGILFWQGLGTRVAPTSGPELASAFQTGLIDVAVAVPTFYVAAGVNRVAPILTLNPLFQAPGATVLHLQTWEKLSVEQRNALERAVQRHPPTMIRAEVREFEQRMLAAHVQGGGTIVRLTPAQGDAFRAIATPLWPKMVAEAGPEGARFFEQVEAARAACAHKR